MRGTYAVSLRRACGLMQIGMSSFYYKAKPADDGTLRDALKEAAVKRKRWGYRMLTAALRRAGFIDNHKRIYRVYREEGSRFRFAGNAKRQCGGARSPNPPATTTTGGRWTS